MNLEIENLSKRYPNGVQALKGVSLVVRPGMFGLLGPNGAGKSTLMRTLATLQEADSGSVRLGDIDVLGDTDAVRRVLGYLPQEFGLPQKISAQTLLDHLARLKGFHDARLQRNTPPALRYVLADDFEEISLYENHAVAATYAKRPDGRFDVTMELALKKVHADGMGTEHEVSMDDFIPVGVTDADGNALALETRRLRSGTAKVTLVVDKVPAKAGIDPVAELIDRQPDDNLVAVTPGG